MHLHRLPPPPRPVDFSAHLIPTSSSSVSPLHLSRTTQLREGVRSVLSDAAAASSSSSSGVVEIKLVQAIEDYLPCIIGVFNSCQTDELVWRRDAWFVWPPLLAQASSSKASSSSGPFASTSILFEVDHVMILYSLALSNLAALQYISVGSYEFDRSLSDADRKQKETILKRGINFSRKAIAVVRWLIEDLAQDDEQASQEWYHTRGRLLEGLVALHHLPPTLISLRLLKSPTRCEIQSTQQLPPPLPKSHPSPSLLAKLYLEVPRLAGEARSNLAAAGGLEANVGPGAAPRRLKNLLGDTGSSSSKLASRFKGLGLGGNRRAGAADDGDEYDEIAGSPGDGNGSGEGEQRRTGRFGRRTSATAAPLSPSSPSTTTATSAPAGTFPPPTQVPLSKMLMGYLESMASFGRSAAFMHLGLSAGESHASKHGEAVVWLQMALAELETILQDESRLDDLVGRAERLKMDRHYSKTHSNDKDLSWQYKTEKKQMLAEQQRRPSSPAATSSASAASHHPLTHRLQSHHTHLIRSLRLGINHALEVYTRLNNSISFQPLPQRDDLYTRIPTSRSIFSATSPAGDGGDSPAVAWKCPKPEFGPGSASATKAAEAASSSAATSGESSWPPPPGSTGLINGHEEARNEYVGKGAYY